MINCRVKSIGKTMKPVVLLILFSVCSPINDGTYRMVEVFPIIFDISGETQDVSDPEVLVAFPILGDSDEASFVAWTTTLSTLPGHLELCVNAKFTYLNFRFLHHSLDN